MCFFCLILCFFLSFCKHLNWTKSILNAPKITYCNKLVLRRYKIDLKWGLKAAKVVVMVEMVVAASNQWTVFLNFDIGRWRSLLFYFLHMPLLSLSFSALPFWLCFVNFFSLSCSFSNFKPFPINVMHK